LKWVPFSILISKEHYVFAVLSIWPVALLLLFHSIIQRAKNKEDPNDYPDKKVPSRWYHWFVSPKVAFENKFTNVMYRDERFLEKVNLQT
jgi:hypothetical protein